MQSVDKTIREANKFLKNKEFVKAQDLFKSILQNYPKNLRAINGLKEIGVSSLPNISKNSEDLNSKLEMIYGCYDRGDYFVTIEHAKNLTKFHPNNYLIHNILGAAYVEINDFENAKKNYLKSIKINPKGHSARNNLGVMYKKNKQYDEAIKIYKDLLKDTPNDINLYINLGNALTEKGDSDEAIRYFKIALDQKDDFALAHHNLGIAYKNNNSIKLAISHFKKAICIFPTYSDAIICLADVYRDINEIELALRHYHETLLIEKDDRILTRIGILYFELCQFNKAEEYYLSSISYNPKSSQAYFNLSLLNLFKGNFKKGFLNFNWRWEFENFNSKPLVTDKPKWALGKKENFVIWPEQGIGDQILFSRFFHDLADYTNNLDIVVDPKLTRYLASSFPDFKFKLEVSSKNFKSHIPIGDLPSLFIDNFSDVIDRSEAYLKVDKNRRDDLKKLLPTNKRICGLSWLSKNEELGSHKSLTLEQLKDILLIKDMAFVDLQYTDTALERKEFLEKHGVEIIKIEQVDNFDDLIGLTALIDACDFVLSVSNTTVHLSGAIGKKTFLMLPKGKGKLWYWSKEGQQSHWYKSVKIYEQDKIGHWDPVIANLYSEIKN